MWTHVLKCMSVVMLKSRGWRGNSRMLGNTTQTIRTFHVQLRDDGGHKETANRLCVYNGFLLSFTDTHNINRKAANVNIPLAHPINNDQMAPNSTLSTKKNKKPVLLLCFVQDKKQRWWQKRHRSSWSVIISIQSESRIMRPLAEFLSSGPMDRE